MPSRTDIDPVEIPSLLPIALLAEVSGTRARIRLLGAEATAAYGAECRGTVLDDIELGDFTAASNRIMATVLESRLPAAAAGSFEGRTELNSVEMVLTPLSYDGRAISHLFGGLVIKPMARVKRIEPKTPATYISNKVGAGISRLRAYASNNKAN